MRIYIVVAVLLFMSGCLGLGTPEVPLPEGANSLGLVKYHAKSEGLMPGTSAEVTGCYITKEGATALQGRGQLKIEFEGCSVTYGTAP